MILDDQILGILKYPLYRTKTYGRYSMFVRSVYVFAYKDAIKMLHFISSEQIN